MYIAAPLGRLGLRGAAARRSATWPLALVGLGATSHTCDSLCAIAQIILLLPFGRCSTLPRLNILRTCMGNCVINKLRHVLMLIFSFTILLGCIPPKRTYLIGDTGPTGGTIFYDQGSAADGWRYLEAAPYDQSAGIRWANASTTGATETSVGSGQANTTTIVSSIGGSYSYAAKLCDDLYLNGYSDWYLPSIDELALLSENLAQHGLGDFEGNSSVGSSYWSSSEISSGTAWTYIFGYWETGNNTKRL